jgi:membrane-associated phospholipid phosphatase
VVMSLPFETRPPAPRGAERVAKQGSFCMRVTEHYTFVDYATQIYSALVTGLILLFHNSTVLHWKWLTAAHIVQMVIVHWLIGKQARDPFNKAVDFLRHFYPVILFLWFFSETGGLNRMFFTRYLDATVIRWEQHLFGFQPSARFMEWLPYVAISELFYAAYFSYYIMIIGVGVALFRRERSEFFHYLSVLSFVFYICYLLYILLPVVGPPMIYFQPTGQELPPDLQTAFPNPVYPDAVRSGPLFQLMALLYRIFDSPGAAMPSSHVAVALCTVFFSFNYRLRLRHLHLAAAILLCCSTVYCRYHYVMDVLAGILAAGLLVPLGNWLFGLSSRSFSHGAEPGKTLN